MFSQEKWQILNNERWTEHLNKIKENYVKIYWVFFFLNFKDFFLFSLLFGVKVSHDRARK